MDNFYRILVGFYSPLQELIANSKNAIRPLNLSPWQHRAYILNNISKDNLLIFIIKKFSGQVILVSTLKQYILNINIILLRFRIFKSRKAMKLQLPD